MGLPGSIKGLLKTGGRMTSGMVCAFLRTVWLHWCGGGVGGKRSDSIAFPGRPVGEGAFPCLPVCS